jgi:aminopeptidase N
MGRADDAAIDAELALDPTDAGRRHAAASRASIPDAAHKAAAWQLVVQSQELGHEGVAAVAAGFGQPEHAELLAPYVDLYFAALPEIWATRGDHLRRLLGDGLFPHWAASPELLRQVDDFLAAEPRDPSMVRVLVERRDIVDRALRSRALGE